MNANALYPIGTPVTYKEKLYYVRGLCAYSYELDLFHRDELSEKAYSRIRIRTYVNRNRSATGLIKV